MSQEKVDRQKAVKAGRKQQKKKDKMKKTIGIIVLVVIVVAIAVWIGYSVFSRVTNGSGNNRQEVNLDSLQNYMQEIDDEVNGTDEKAEDSETGAAVNGSDVSE